MVDVRNHDSPQWYDIVHFEHKLSWLCFGLPQKASYQWRCIPLLINPRSFSKLADVGLSFIIQHLPSNKVCLPLIEARLLFFWSHLFDIRGFTNLLARLSLGHNSNAMLEITTLHNGMILSTLSISSRGFVLGFPKRPHTNGDVFLYL